MANKVKYSSLKAGDQYLFRNEAPIYEVLSVIPVDSPRHHYMVISRNTKTGKTHGVCALGGWVIWRL